VDEVKNQMESVTRLYFDLDSRIAGQGGVENLFGLNRKIRQTLDSISMGELDNLLNEIHRAKDGLTRLQADIVEIRILKEVVASSAGAVNGGGR
jgi:hypothetical protein